MYGYVAMVPGISEIYIAILSPNRRSELLYPWRKTSSGIHGGQPGVEGGIEMLLYNLCKLLNEIQWVIGI